MTIKKTVTKERIANDAIIHLAASKNNALEVAIADIKKWATIIEETYTSIIYEYEDTDYSKYHKYNEEDGSNKNL